MIVVLLFEVLANDSSVVIREFAKKGIPLTCRASAWKSILNVSVDDIVTLTLTFYFLNFSVFHEFVV